MASLQTALTYFVGFLFGFLRDRWRPMGKGDRGYFLVVPLLMAATFLWLGANSQSYPSLLAGMVVLSALSALLGAAAQGLMAAIAKDSGMMGRLSVVALVSFRGSLIYQQVAGGWLGDHASRSTPYVLSAVVCLGVLVMAFWRPKSIFRSGDEVFVSVIPEGWGAAAKRVVRHKAIYVPAMVIFLWEFAPGWGTPLFFFLTDKVKLTEAEFGASQGWLRFGTVVAALSYSWLCTRFRFKRLLQFGTFVGVLGAPAFLLIHSPIAAYAVSLVAGISCGIALASYYDLLVRSCPKELEGVAFMLTYAMMSLASDTSDIFGSYLYEKGGFGLALAISTLFTALIFIPILSIPKAVLDPSEGMAIVDLDGPGAVVVA